MDWLLFASNLLCCVLGIFIGVMFCVPRTTVVQKEEEEKDEGEYHTSTCPLCNKQFNWKGADALAKYGPGKGYLIACPDCDTLIHIIDS